MKKILLFFLSVVLVSSAFSQIKKGNFLAGGNASFTAFKQESLGTTVKENTITIAPDAGYFIFNKAAAGLRAGFSSDKHTGGQDITFTSVSLSPFVRYYFLPLKNSTNIFADASYDYTAYTGKTNSSSQTTKANGYTVSAGPAIFLNKTVALEIAVGYKYSKLKNYDTKETNFVTSAGFQIHLGKSKS